MCLLLVIFWYWCHKSRHKGSSMSDYQTQRICKEDAIDHWNHHTTTILRPFFRDHLGELMPEENFWTLWCKGRLTEADTLNIRLGATPSGLTIAHLHHPPIVPLEIEKVNLKMLYSGHKDMVWVSGCFFWYWLTRVDLGKGPLNRLFVVVDSRLEVGPLWSFEPVPLMMMMTMMYGCVLGEWSEPAGLQSSGCRQRSAFSRHWSVHLRLWWVWSVRVGFPRSRFCVGQPQLCHQTQLSI